MNLRDIGEISTVWSHSSDILVDHALGCWLYDKKGVSYPDMTSGIGC